MTLFDPSEFGGPERRPRRRRQRPDEIRLAPPWVLLSNRRGPVAHLLAHNAVPNENGGWRTRCGRIGYKVTVDGRPMAKVCHACLDLSGESGTL